MFVPNRTDAWVVHVFTVGTSVHFEVGRTMPVWNEKTKQWEPLEMTATGEGWTRRWYPTQEEARESVGLDMLEQRKGN